LEQYGILSPEVGLDELPLRDRLTTIGLETCRGDIPIEWKLAARIGAINDRFKRYLE
jgi:hypothetical protein